MQISSINTPTVIEQNVKQQNSVSNGFDIMYNQLISENNTTTPMQELIDGYKADLLSQLEETPNSSMRSSDILNLMLNIK